MRVMRRPTTHNARFHMPTVHTRYLLGANPEDPRTKQPSSAPKPADRADPASPLAKSAASRAPCTHRVGASADERSDRHRGG